MKILSTKHRPRNEFVALFPHILNAPWERLINQEFSNGVIAVSASEFYIHGEKQDGSIA